LTYKLKKRLYSVFLASGLINSKRPVINKWRLSFVDRVTVSCYGNGKLQNNRSYDEAVELAKECVICIN